MHLRRHRQQACTPPDAHNSNAVKSALMWAERCGYSLNSPQAAAYQKRHARQRKNNAVHHFKMRPSPTSCLAEHTRSKLRAIHRGLQSMPTAQQVDRNWHLASERARPGIARTEQELRKVERSRRHTLECNVWTTGLRNKRIQTSFDEDEWQEGYRKFEDSIRHVQGNNLHQKNLAHIGLPENFIPKKLKLSSEAQQEQRPSSPDPNDPINYKTSTHSYFPQKIVSPANSSSPANISNNDLADSPTATISPSSPLTKQGNSPASPAASSAPNSLQLESQTAKENRIVSKSLHRLFGRMTTWMNNIVDDLRHNTPENYPHKNMRRISPQTLATLVYQSLQRGDNITCAVKVKRATRRDQQEWTKNRAAAAAKIAADRNKMTLSTEAPEIDALLRTGNNAAENRDSPFDGVSSTWLYRDDVQQTAQKQYASLSHQQVRKLVKHLLKRASNDGIVTPFKLKRRLPAHIAKNTKSAVAQQANTTNRSSAEAAEAAASAKLRAQQHQLALAQAADEGDIGAAPDDTMDSITTPTFTTKYWGAGYGNFVWDSRAKEFKRYGTFYTKPKTWELIAATKPSAEDGPVVTLPEEDVLEDENPSPSIDFPDDGGSPKESKPSSPLQRHELSAVEKERLNAKETARAEKSHAATLAVAQCTAAWAMFKQAQGDRSKMPSFLADAIDQARLLDMSVHVPVFNSTKRVVRYGQRPPDQS